MEALKKEQQVSPDRASKERRGVALRLRSPPPEVLRACAPAWEEEGAELEEQLLEDKQEVEEEEQTYAYNYSIPAQQAYSGMLISPVLSLLLPLG